MKKLLLSTLIFGALVGLGSTATYGNSPLDPTTMAYDPQEGYEVKIPSTFTLGYAPLAISKASYDSGPKDFLGGEWRHGVNDRHVWSHFWHNSKVHSTTVQGKGSKRSTSGWIDAGETASASWEKALYGNRAWANVK